MHAMIKVLLGLVLIGVGLALFVDSVYPMVDIPVISNIDWLGNFIVLLTGFIPPFLIIIGLFVVWLEIDEIKAEKEIRAEEKKEKKEKEKPKSSKKK